MGSRSAKSSLRTVEVLRAVTKRRSIAPVASCMLLQTGRHGPIFASASHYFQGRIKFCCAQPAPLGQTSTLSKSSVSMLTPDAALPRASMRSSWHPYQLPHARRGRQPSAGRSVCRRAKHLLPRASSATRRSEALSKARGQGCLWAAAFNMPTNRQIGTSAAIRTNRRTGTPQQLLTTLVLPMGDFD